MDKNTVIVCIVWTLTCSFSTPFQSPPLSFFLSIQVHFCFLASDYITRPYKVLRSFSLFPSQLLYNSQPYPFIDTLSLSLSSQLTVWHSASVADWDQRRGNVQLAMSAVATGTSCSEKHSKVRSTQPAADSFRKSSVWEKCNTEGVLLTVNRVSHSFCTQVTIKSLKINDMFPLMRFIKHWKW